MGLHLVVCALVVKAGFSCSIESIEIVLNFKIGFQDLEKVWNLKMEKIRSVK